MKKQTGFLPNADRYQFDSKLCKTGFAQVDTGQDASYYGIWANPVTLEVAEYAEGDYTHKKAESKTEFIEELRIIEAYHTKYNDFIGIDPGWNIEPLTTLFTNLGLGDLLHGDDRRVKRSNIKILLGDKSGSGYPHWLLDKDRPKALEIAKELNESYDPKEMPEILGRLNAYL